MDYILLRTDRPLDAALRSFLTRRMRARGETLMCATVCPLYRCH